MIQLWTFGMAMFGFVIYAFITTWRRDTEDPAALTPMDIIWAGPAKWKTCAQVMFIFAVCVFFPPDFLQKTVGAEIGGVPIGKGAAVVFGVLSDALMVKIFRIKEKAANGNGNGGEAA